MVEPCGRVEGADEAGSHRPGAVEDLRFRPLTDDERDTLVAVLEACGPGRALLDQVPSTLVSRTDLPTFADLRVVGAAPVEGLGRGPLPAGDTAIGVVDDVGGEVGGILIWVDDGYLGAFEFSWYVDDRPVAWPRRENLRVRHRPATGSPAAPRGDPPSP